MVKGSAIVEETWNNLIDNLYNASLVCLSSGPGYTYSSGGRFTTIDYVLTNQDGTRGISSCSTLEDHPLNTSDHLPILCTLDVTHLRVEPAPVFPSIHLDWSKAVKAQDIHLYSNAIDDIVRPLLGKD